MKYHFSKSRLAALALGAFAASAACASAQNPFYAPGHLVLTFQNPGGSQGSAQTVMFSLGSAQTLRTAAGTSTPIAIGNIGSLLNSTFGATWHSQSTLWMGAVGNIGTTIGTTLTNGDPQRTVYSTKPRLAVGTPGQTTGSSSVSASNASGVSSAINASNNKLESLASTAAAAIPVFDTEDSTNNSLIPNYNPFVVPGQQATAYTAIQGGVQTTFGAGTLGTFGTLGAVEAALDVFRHQPRNDIANQYGPNLPTAVGAFIGTITINAAGDVAFTPAAVAPDPDYVPPVGNEPVVSAGQNFSGTVGVALNYQIVASNSPTSYALAAGSTLPAGLTLNTATGAISGTPTAAGNSSPSFTATNADGTSDPVAIAITIAAAPEPINALGKYHGVVGDLGSMDPSTANTSIEDGFQSVEGGLTVSVDKKNNFSGSITRNGVKYSGKGPVDANGSILNSTWTSKSGNAVVNLTIVSNVDGAFYYRGTAQFGGTTLDALAGLASFSKTTPYTTPGMVTIQLPLGVVTVPVDTTLQGAGVGTGSISTVGAAKLAGSLPDGAKWKGTFYVFATTGKAGEQIILFNAAPYKTGGGFGGWALRAINEPDSDWNGIADWSAPAPTKAGSRFPGGIEATTQVLVSNFTKPAKGARVLAWPNGDGELAVQGGQLAQTETGDLNLSTKNKLTLTNFALAKAKATVSATKGTAGGSFVHPVTNKAVKMIGALNQKNNTVLGYFLSPQASGLVVFED